MTDVCVANRSDSRDKAGNTACVLCVGCIAFVFSLPDFLLNNAMPDRIDSVSQKEREKLAIAFVEKHT